MRITEFLRKGFETGHERGEERGQSMIELAVAMPVLLLVLLGAVEFGRLSYAAIEVANAARAGVAYGSQSAATAADIAGMQNAATNDSGDLAGWRLGGVTATASQVCSCSTATAGVTCANAGTMCAGSRTLVSVQVNTTANVDPLIYVPGMPHRYTLNGHATMRVQ
jgi:Flp pilus assembly protein TadG